MDFFEKVRVIIANSLGCDENAVTPEADIKEDLGADSLAVVELIMAIEDAFNVTVAEEEAASVVTVGDVVKLVAEKAA